jgi:succinate dehydrogenase / fumarate reductase flavoprotein subunit
MPGLFVLGEANFSDHGANRLGASALMQGLADGYFVAPYTMANYLGGTSLPAVSPTTTPSSRGRAGHAGPHGQGARGEGQADVRDFHRNSAGSAGTSAAWARTEDRPQERLQQIPKMRDEFWQNVSVTGRKNNLNQPSSYAGRVADYLEFAEMLALDALERERVVRRSLPRGVPDARRRGQRDDEKFSYVAAWEYQGVGNRPNLHKEARSSSRSASSQVRSYK